MTRLRRLWHRALYRLATAAHAHQDVTDLIAEVERLHVELAPYEALQLGHPDGRISTTCTAGKHPTWLRYPDDTRYYACPWCALDDAAATAR